MMPLDGTALPRRSMVGARGELEGRVAVIVGAAQGMGRAVAERFAAEGAILVVVDVRGDAVRSLASSLTERGVEAIAEQLDIANAEQVAALISHVITDTGRLDV